MKNKVMKYHAIDSSEFYRFYDPTFFNVVSFINNKRYIKPLVNYLKDSQQLFNIFIYSSPF